MAGSMSKDLLKASGSARTEGCFSSFCLLCTSFERWRNYVIDHVRASRDCLVGIDVETSEIADNSQREEESDL